MRLPSPVGFLVPVLLLACCALLSPIAEAARPDKPTNLRAEVGDGQVTLTWAYSGAPPTHWQYAQKKANREASWDWKRKHEDGLRRSFVVTGLTNGVAYNFIVRAKNEDGEGPASDGVVATPMAPPSRPGTPSGFQATPGSAQVKLTWDPLAGATGWQLQRKLASSTTWSTPIDIQVRKTVPRRHTVMNLNNGTTYDFRVRGTNDVGEGPWSDTKEATPASVLSQPVVSAEPRDAAVTLIIQLRSSNADSYDYRFKTGSGSGSAVSCTGDNWGNWKEFGGGKSALDLTVTNLENETPYCFQVCAVDADGRGPASAPVHATPGPAVSLDAPASVREGDTLTITVKLREPLSTDVTIPLTFFDYQTTLSSILIPRGQRQASAQIVTTQDADADDEYFFVRFGTLPSAVTRGGSDSVPVRILDDEGNPPPPDGGDPNNPPTNEGNAGAGGQGDGDANEDQPNGPPQFIGTLAFIVPENQAGVGSLTATDEDGDGVTGYTLVGGADRALFAITERGQLSFLAPPDYEGPQDAASDDPVDVAKNNRYVLVVQATSGTGSRIRTAERTVTVTVTNVDEDPVGLPTISGTPRRKRTLTALTDGIADPDGLTAPEFRYQWIRVTDGQETDILGETGKTYVATGDDVGSTLRMRVEFTDDGGFRETLTSAATAPVADDTDPVFSGGAADQSWKENTPIVTLTLPEASGGDGVLTYRLDLLLPAGTLFDAESRTIAGTPTEPQDAITYTWTVTDADGDEASLSFSIAIAPDLVPNFAATVADQGWKQNTPIVSLTLPTAEGGDGELTYRLDPVLPAGLLLDLGALVIEGTPTEPQETATYTWTATDTDGDEASLAFTIAIAPDLMPDFGDAAIADQAWEENEPLPVVTLPEATGGDGELTYRIDPALPAGALLDIVSRVISGTPKETQEAVTYTWTATDADGDEASLTFRVTVVADSLPGRRRAAGNALAAIAQNTLAGAAGALGRRFEVSVLSPVQTPPPATSPSSRSANPPVALSAGSGVDGNSGDTPIAPAQGMANGARLASSGFAMPLAGNRAQGDRRWTVWGWGDMRQFHDDFNGGQDGSLQTGWMGADVRLDGGPLVDAAVSRGRGQVDYRLTDGTARRLTTTLTTVWPYLHASSPDVGSASFMVGAGRGEASIASPQGGRAGFRDADGDLELLAGLFAASRTLSRTGSFTLSAMGDVGVIRMASDGEARSALADLAVLGWRARGGMEVQWDGASLLDSPWTLAPRLSLSTRHDGGHGLTGTGLEAAGGVVLAAPGSHFRIEADAHWLGVHSVTGTRRWGATLEARLRPRQDGRGLSASVGPRLGTSRDWDIDGGVFDGQRPDGPDATSLNAEVAYGFDAFCGTGLLVPWLAFGDRGPSGRELRLGTRLSRGALDVSLEGGLEETSFGGPQHHIGLHLRMQQQMPKAHLASSPPKQDSPPPVPPPAQGTGVQPPLHTAPAPTQHEAKKPAPPPLWIHLDSDHWPARS